jgi:hypothetical protein
MVEKTTKARDEGARTRLKELGTLMRFSWFGALVIIMMRDLIDSHVPSGKRSAMVTIEMNNLFDYYLQGVKLFGGSCAGAFLARVTARAGNAPNRQSRRARGQNPEIEEAGEEEEPEEDPGPVPDPTGISNLANSKRELAKTADVQTVDDAAANLLLCVKELVHDNYFGLRKNANRFGHLDLRSSRDAFAALDRVFSQLDGLEALLSGVDALIFEERDALTQHHGDLYDTEMVDLQEFLYDRFFELSPELAADSRLFTGRQIHINLLQYAADPSYQERPGPSSSNAAVIAAKLLEEVLADQTLSGRQIQDQMHSRLSRAQYQSLVTHRTNVRRANAAADNRRERGPQRDDKKGKDKGDDKKGKDKGDDKKGKGPALPKPKKSDDK